MKELKDQTQQAAILTFLEQTREGKFVEISKESLDLRIEAETLVIESDQFYLYSIRN